MAGRTVLLALAAAGCAAGGPSVPVATPHPVRVVSMNQCADQLVLALLPPERIASVTWLSRDPAVSLMADAAGRVGVNHGLAEEVVAQRPDLIVAGSFTTPAVRTMLKRLGYPMIEVDQPESFEAIRTVTRQVAAAVGETARGESLIADMDAKLAALTRAATKGPTVVAWDRAGFSAGEGTLYAAVLAAAGARNLGDSPAALHYRHPDVEALLHADPQLLVQGGGTANAPSLGDDVARHRAVRERWRGRTVRVPQTAYACGTPMVADAAMRLRAELLSAAAAAPVRSGS